MSSLDRIALAFNAAAPLLLFGALVGDSEEMAILATLVGFVALMLSSAAILRRSASHEPARKSMAPEAIDEMNPAKVLDLDARLEALEQREQEMQEAQRIRLMVARGEQNAYAEPLANAVPGSGMRERV